MKLPLCIIVSLWFPCLYHSTVVQGNHKDTVVHYSCLHYTVLASTYYGTVAEKDTAATAKIVLGPPESRRWPPKGRPSAVAGAWPPRLSHAQRSHEELHVGQIGYRILVLCARAKIIYARANI